MSAGGPATRVLMMTSNGVGLGHLTRTMAVARRLPEHVVPVIFTLSQGFPLAKSEGFVTEFLASASHGYLRPSDWHRLLTRRIGELIAEYEPGVVTFDGLPAPGGLRAAIDANPGPIYVWFRRGMWKADVAARHLAPTSHFDHVLEPGELAAEDDTGLTSRARQEVRQLSPMTLLDDHELLESADAERELRLPPAAMRVLVQLGAATPEVTTAIVEQCASLARAHEGMQVVVADSPIAHDDLELPARVVRRRIYPVSRHLRAFDLAVASSGYNSYHELLRFGVPTIFVPNVGTAIDDQVTRASYAERIGAARMCPPDDLGDLPHLLGKLLDPGAREAMMALAQGCRFPNGAAEAATIVAELAETRR